MSLGVLVVSLLAAVTICVFSLSIPIPIFTRWVALLAAFAIGTIAYRRFSKPATQLTSRLIAPSNLFSAISGIVWTGLAPTAILAVFIGLSGRPVTWFETWSQPRSTLKSTASITTGEMQPVAASLPSDLESDRNRPEWTFNGDTTQGDVRRVVFSSSLWSTEEEANRELQSRASALLWQDFRERHHDRFDPAQPDFLNDYTVLNSAVKNRFSQVKQHDFGKFSAPMTQTWWQVEVSPAVRTELYPDWRTALVQNRIVVVGAVISLLTLVANMMAFFFRLLEHRWNSLSASTAALTASLSWAALHLWIAGQLIV